MILILNMHRNVTESMVKCCKSSLPEAAASPEMELCNAETRWHVVQQEKPLCYSTRETYCNPFLTAYLLFRTSCRAGYCEIYNEGLHDFIEYNNRAQAAVFFHAT